MQEIVLARIIHNEALPVRTYKNPRIYPPSVYAYRILNSEYFFILTADSCIPYLCITNFKYFCLEAS